MVFITIWRIFCYFIVLAAEDRRFLPAPLRVEVYSMKLKIQEVYDGKEKRFLQSINFW